MAARRGGVDRLDVDTAAYFSEMSATFATLTDPEEAALLAGSALAEIKGKEAVAACDATSSRFLEKLVAAADADAVLSFMEALVKGEHVDDMPPLIAIAIAPFGSHVAEHLLDSLGKIAVEADDELLARVTKVLEDLCTLMAEWNLYNVITNPSGSHVARKLLCVVTGRDVSPTSGRDAGKNKGGGKKPTGLAAKMSVSKTVAEDNSAAFPGMARIFTRTLLGEAYIEHIAGDLIYNAYAGPFLQALLNACADDGEVLVELIAAMLGAGPSEGGAGQRLASLADVDFHAVMQERTSSHLMEVILGVAPPALFTEIWQRGFLNALLELSLDGSANFVVQAALALLKEPSQVKEALAELKDGFSDLLGRRRTGVIAALLAAASRLKTAQVDACKALSRGLTAMPSADVAKRGLAPVLLTLDSGGRLGDAAIHDGPGGRLYPAGCAMLAVILSYPLDACQQFANSVSSLPPADAERVGRDAGGVRVLEALIQGPASAKQKTRLLRALAGRWATLASEFSSSHLVEKCYAQSGPQDKEAIVQDLANSRKLLYNAPRGSAVLRACGVDSYLKSPAEWRQRAATAAAARDQFSQLFGDNGAKEGGEQVKPSNGQASAAVDAVEGEGPRGGHGGAAGESVPHPESKKGKKQNEGASAEGDVPSKAQSSTGGEGAKVKEEKKKRRKKGPDAADARDKAVDEVRARAAVLGGQRTADVMQLLGFGNSAEADNQKVSKKAAKAPIVAASNTPAATSTKRRRSVIPDFTPSKRQAAELKPAAEDKVVSDEMTTVEGKPKKDKKSKAQEQVAQSEKIAGGKLESHAAEIEVKAAKRPKKSKADKLAE